MDIASLAMISPSHDLSIHPSICLSCLAHPSTRNDYRVTNVTRRPVESDSLWSTFGAASSRYCKLPYLDLGWMKRM